MGPGKAVGGSEGKEAQVSSPSSQLWLRLCPGSGGLQAVSSAKAEGVLRMAGGPARALRFALTSLLLPEWLASWAQRES